MSSVTAFASALAANLCTAVDGSMAFCFVRDVETEQLLGAYAARPAVSGQQDARHAATGHDNQGECVDVPYQPGSAVEKNRTMMPISPKGALQSCLSAFTVKASKPVFDPLLHLMYGRQLHMRCMTAVCILVFHLA